MNVLRFQIRTNYSLTYSTLLIVCISCVVTGVPPLPMSCGVLTQENDTALGLVSTNIFTVDGRLNLIADCRQLSTKHCTKFTKF